MNIKIEFCDSSQNNSETQCKCNQNSTFLFLMEFKKLILKLTLKCKGPTSIYEGEEENGGFALSHIKIWHKI